jgi:hypothetical protein
LRLNLIYRRNRHDRAPDAAVNYRYQLVGDGTTAVAFSPRLTLLVPTGDAGRALGTGGLGAQVNLPMSAVLSPGLVSHTNLGATHVFAAKGQGGAESITEAWLSPGIRFALNLPGHLQVVPGVAVPIGIGPSRGKTGLFLYFSVELPLLGANDRIRT